MSNHAHVLACIAADSGVRLRDVAASVGITERAAQSIVADLVEHGYVSRTREGRRNRYTVNRAAPLRHQADQHLDVGALLDFLVPRRSVPMPALATISANGNGNGNGHH